MRLLAQRCKWDVVRLLYVHDVAAATSPLERQRLPGRTEGRGICGVTKRIGLPWSFRGPRDSVPRKRSFFPEGGGHLVRAGRAVARQVGGRHGRRMRRRAESYAPVKLLEPQWLCRRRSSSPESGTEHDHADGRATRWARAGDQHFWRRDALAKLEETRPLQKEVTTTSNSPRLPAPQQPNGRTFHIEPWHGVELYP